MDKKRNRMPQTRLLGKPVYWVSTSPFNPKSGFIHKRLCDGPTLTAGTACAYSCRYCYVESQIYKQAQVREILAAAQLDFQHLVIRRQAAVAQLIQVLSRRKLRGETSPTCAELLPARLHELWTGPQPLSERVPRYLGSTFAGRVVFASPTVDVAATRELAEETVTLAEVLLRLSAYDLRLLSKSPLLAEVVAPSLAARLPGVTKDRVIFGLSTGTLDDHVAAAIEPVPPPSRRLAALHRLQDDGFRTFGMLCPILPPADPGDFALQALAAIRAERCETIWAEPVNFRGTRATAEPEHHRQTDSFTATLQALQRGGHAQVAERFAEVAESPLAWEEYCRATFKALAAAAPIRADGTSKLIWLQYPRNFASIENFWQAATQRGALLLGGIVTGYRRRQQVEA